MKRQILITFWGLGCLVALVGPPQALAQDRTDFSQLESTVKPNDKLIVTINDGTEIEGRMLAVSSEQVVVKTKDGPNTFTTSQIMKVERKKNGFLMGLVLGAGAGLPLSLLATQYSQNEGGGPVLSPIVIGAAIGTVIDLASPSYKTLYDRNAKPRISMAPVVGKNRLGAQVAIRF